MYNSWLRAQPWLLLQPHTIYSCSKGAGVWPRDWRHCQEIGHPSDPWIVLDSLPLGQNVKLPPLCVGLWLICQRRDGGLIGRENVAPVTLREAFLTDSLERQNCVCSSGWNCNQISSDFRPWHMSPWPSNCHELQEYDLSVLVGDQRAPCLAPRPWLAAM